MVNPNNMMLSDHIYSWDSSQNVQFPAALNAAGGLKENGTALSAKYQPKGNYAVTNHTHTKSQITDMPTQMANPEILHIEFNGRPWAVYDGSSYTEINVTPSNIGAADSSHRHSSTGLKSCTLTASGWSSTAPYTQTVSVPGVTSTDNPIISLDIPDGTTAANESAMLKAFGYLSNAKTGSGTITFKCISKKPTLNLSLSVLVF